MPRDASPCARSWNGRSPPIVSSRSCGPEPCTRTTAGKGPFAQRNRERSRDSDPEPETTFTSLSRNASGFT